MFHHPSPFLLYLRQQQQLKTQSPISASSSSPHMDAFSRYTEYADSSRVKIGITERAASGAKKQRKKKRNDPLKIVYISSPMKVQTCQSMFRSLVQELTGKDSQVAMFMEVSSSHVAEETSQPAVSDSTSTQVAGVEDKADLFQLWPVTSDQSFSVTDEEEFGNYVIDENFAAGGGGYGFSSEFDLPWQLLME